MSDLLAVFTLPAIAAAIVGGLVFGVTLPWLFAALTEGLIPDSMIAILNRAAVVLVPGLALPLLASMWTTQIVAEMEAGGPWLRLVGRAGITVIFVAAVTVGDVVIQRFRLPDVEHRVDERVAATDRAAEASERRVARMRLERLRLELDSQRRRRVPL